MYLNHDELMLLSRGGRVPRAERPRPGPVGPRPRPPRPGPRGPRGPRGQVRRLVAQIARLSRPLRGRTAPPAGQGELNPHAYLELEFVLKDES